MEVVAATLLAVAVALLLLGSPVLAIVAILRSRGQQREIAALKRRLSTLEQEADPGHSAAPERGAAAEAAVGEAHLDEDRVPAASESFDAAVSREAVAASADPATGSSGARAEEPTHVRRPHRPDLESRIAGRWLNRIGVLAVLMAVAFFLRFAFENQWIGPLGRIVIGLLAGSGLLVASQWLFGRGMKYFSEGITGLGGGVLFLSLYAAWGFYDLIGQPAALVGMVLVTGTLAALAFGRASQRLAVLALLGGLGTPGLLASDVDRYLALFGFLSVLVGCFLVLAWLKTWRWVAPVAFMGATFYWVAWQAEHYSDSKLWPAVALVSLLYALFAAYFLARLSAFGDRFLKLPEMLLALTSSGAYAAVLYSLLQEEHRWLLTILVLGLAALHLLATRAFGLGESRSRGAARFAMAGMALALATSAVPIRLEGEAISIALAIEAAVLVWAGFRVGQRPLRLAGSALLGAVLLVLLAGAGAVPEQAFLNARFASFCVVFAALAACLVWASPRLAELGHERWVYGALSVAATLTAVWGLSEQTWILLGQQDWDVTIRKAQQMGLSLLWAVAAGALILIGVKVRSRVWRWQGLVLLAVVIVKVFLFDLSFLERAYRVASLLVLGIVLLAVSYAYQRASRGEMEERGKLEE